MENENKEIKNEVMLERAARIVKLDGANSRFEMKNGFLSLTTVEDGEEKIYDRVFLHRDFPHELLWEYISVTGNDSKEIGLIYNIEDFADNDKALLIQEIERKYYSPAIKEIHGLKERYGFSYWKVTVEDGREINFTMQDTFKNIIRIGDDRAMLIDVDGNRYTIKSITDLDRKSYRKIELYL
jgi:hypothetical protein